MAIGGIAVETCFIFSNLKLQNELNSDCFWSHRADLDQVCVIIVCGVTSYCCKPARWPELCWEERIPAETSSGGQRWRRGNRLKTSPQTRWQTGRKIVSLFMNYPFKNPVLCETYWLWINNRLFWLLLSVAPAEQRPVSAEGDTPAGPSVPETHTHTQDCWTTLHQLPHTHTHTHTRTHHKIK